MAADGCVYPSLGGKEDAYDAVQIIIDDYNVTIDYTKNTFVNPSKQSFMYI